MGMPGGNGKLISLRQSPTVEGSKRSSERNSPGSGSMPIVRPNLPPDKPLDRNLSAPELPPIGIKPHSPSYSSSPVSRGHYGSSQELNISADGIIKRTRRSPLSPTSTTSSQEGSNKSQRVSPAGVLHRSRTWTGDLNSSQHGSSKLETLYEATPPAKNDLEQGLAQLSIIQEGKECKTLASTVTSPPPIISHPPIKPNQAITHISSSKISGNYSSPSQLPATSTSKTPQLTVSTVLSQENLKKHRNLSQSSSLSSSAVKANSDTGYDTDDEKEHRIVEWLVGVETSHTEQPPDAGSMNTNEKRDTAIHIVYEGD